MPGWCVAERTPAVEAFRALGALSKRARRIVEANRALFRESLRAWDAVECAPFDATIAFPRFRDGRDASAFAEGLFERDGVAVVPGAFFGLPDHFRISLGGRPEAVRDGLHHAAAGELVAVRRHRGLRTERGRVRRSIPDDARRLRVSALGSFFDVGHAQGETPLSRAAAAFARR